MGNPLEAMEALDGKHDVNGVVLTVDLYQKTRNDLVRDCSPGFEQRLVAQRNGADLCYAVHADGLVLLATPSGREAASDLILRLLQHGASCVAKEDYVVIRKKTLSKDEKKDLKSLLDVCTAFGVSFADYNSKASDSASSLTLNVTWSRRWRRGDAASLRRRRCGPMRVYAPRERVAVAATPSS